MCAVVDQSGNVVSRHLGQLLLEDVLEARQDYRAVARIVVVDDAKFDFAFSLFGNRICCSRQSRFIFTKMGAYIL